MTGKRFTVDDGLENVFCWEINDKENEDMTYGGCAKLLNELHEENQLLKLRYETKLFSRRELEKENEQLKQELFESEKECIMIDYRDNPIRRNDKIIDLKEEYKERFRRDFE